MGSKLPPEIKVERLGESGVRYVLPTRELPRVRLLGRWVVLVGVAGLAIPLFEFAHLFPALGKFGLVLLLFVVPGFLFAGFVFFVGMCLAYGHAEIEIREGQLWAIERCRSWQRRWGRPLEQISQLTVFGADGWLARLLGDAALVRAGSPPEALVLAAGYPPALCAALAEELRERIAEAGFPAVVVTAPEGLPALGQPAKPMVVERRVQPPGSKIVIEQFPGGVTLDVPAPGLRGVNLGLVVFGVVFAVIATVFGIITVIAPNNQGGLLLALTVAGAFMAVGSAFVGVGFANARRRAGLAVVDGELMILQTGLRKLERRWAPGDVASVVVGPSGVTVNDKPVLELQVMDLAGKKCGLLGGRSVPELEWIATTLRDTLARTAPAEVLVDNTEQPEAPVGESAAEN